eukprot:7817393-Alexandrium_andersonii.AAC.1
MQDQCARDLTTRMFHEIAAELRAAGGATIVLGDFNADVEAIQPLADLVAGGELVGLGAISSNWGQADSTGTCKPPGAH